MNHMRKKLTFPFHLPSIWVITLVSIVSIGYLPQKVWGQDHEIQLDLETTIGLANNQSLHILRARNHYLSRYWSYMAFKARRLPSLTFSMTPMRYYRDITSRYDSEQNIDIYRPQQSLYTYGHLSLHQNLDWTGGTLFVDTELGYIKNFGDRNHSQFNSTPIRIGYRQALIGFNRFKWEKKIEPMRFESARKELVASYEENAMRASRLYFDLAVAQLEVEMANEELKKSIEFYNIGQERQNLGTITQTDLLNLNVSRLDAENNYKKATLRLKQSMFALASFLKISTKSRITVKVAPPRQYLPISVEEALAHARANNPQYVRSQQEVLSSEQEVDRAKKDLYFDFGISASVGFNQVASTLAGAYRKPLQQDVVTLSLSMPLVDWGMRKDRYHSAIKNLNMTRLSVEQQALELEETIIIAVSRYNMQEKLIESAREVVKIAKMAYEQTQERFLIGKADFNALSMASYRCKASQRSYLSAIREYWETYFNIRRLTLYDFEQRMDLGVDYGEIDYNE